MPSHSATSAGATGVRDEVSGSGARPSSGTASGGDAPAQPIDLEKATRPKEEPPVEEPCTDPALCPEEPGDANITVTGASTIAIGQTKALSAVGGNVAGGGTVTWTSSDPELISVDASGKIKINTTGQERLGVAANSLRDTPRIAQKLEARQTLAAASADLSPEDRAALRRQKLRPLLTLKTTLSARRAASSTPVVDETATNEASDEATTEPPGESTRAPAP